MPNRETNPAPALPLCGIGWQSLRIAILLSVLFLLTACSWFAKPCAACVPEVVTVVQQPTPPPVMLTRPCPPLPAPDEGAQALDDVLDVMLRWADLYGDCRERHGKLVEAVK